MPRYIGGPCNGHPVHEAYYGFVYCGGAKYRLAESGDYVWVGLPVPGEPRPLTGQPHALGAWTKLMRALGKQLPQRLARARLLARQARRVVR